MKKVCKRAIHLCAFEGKFSKQIMKEEKMKKTEDYGKKKIVENKKKLQGDQDGS